MPTKPSPAKPARAPAKAALARKMAKPKQANPDAAAVVAEGAEGAVVAKDDGGLRLKTLIDGVVETSGAKRKDVKTIIEAALVQMGAALARGAGMSLPGLGHVRVAKKATAATPAMTLKLRQGDGKGKTAKTAADAEEKETLAEDSDQG